jgi:DNA repair protein RadB
LERRLSTGCPPLDEILGGGFKFGEVSLIYGEASTGKTILALSCCLGYLNRDMRSKAFYIDADHGLSTPRLVQMAGGDSGILTRFIVMRPESFREQTETVERLFTILPKRPTLVVVDSITGLYRLRAGEPEETFQASKELNRQLGFLSETARETGAAVLLTGQVHGIPGAGGPRVELVAERLLRYWSDRIVRLENTEIPGVRKAVLEKPLEPGRVCRFVIGRAGLVGVDKP